MGIATRIFGPKDSLSGLGNLKLLADRANRTRFDFPMTVNAGDSAVFRLEPDGMRATLPV